MHIVSSVESKLAANKTNCDLMRATFPAGTVSDASKIRANRFFIERRGAFDWKCCRSGNVFPKAKPV
jgi:anthranilate/para-aminobenzoate synthase component I